MGASEENLYVWESNGLYTAINEAHKIAFGKEGLPRVDLQQAKMIVGVGADFLDVGTSLFIMQKDFRMVSLIETVRKASSFNSNRYYL